MEGVILEKKGCSNFAIFGYFDVVYCGMVGMMVGMITACFSLLFIGKIWHNWNRNTSGIVDKGCIYSNSASFVYFDVVYDAGVDGGGFGWLIVWSHCCLLGNTPQIREKWMGTETQMWTSVKWNGRCYFGKGNGYTYIVTFVLLAGLELFTHRSFNTSFLQ